jgi:hypothetical protein
VRNWNWVSNEPIFHLPHATWAIRSTGEMVLTEESWKAQRKPFPVPLWPPKITDGPTWKRNQASEVRSRLHTTETSWMNMSGCTPYSLLQGRSKTIAYLEQQKLKVFIWSAGSFMVETDSIRAITFTPVRCKAAL